MLRPPCHPFSFFVSLTTIINALCPMHAPCPPLFVPCLMSLALGGPVRFYLLFVPDIWCGFVAWFQHVLLASCVICCNLLHLLQFALCSVHALCPPLSAPCLPLALCGPVRFYLLFVPDICYGFVSWPQHVLLASCVICCNLLHSGNLPCVQFIPSALHSVLSVWPCGVLPLLLHNLNCSLSSCLEVMVCVPHCTKQTCKMFSIVLHCFFAHIHVGESSKSVHC